MKIQLWHARDSDFHNDFYIPLKNSSFFSEHEWIFPHDGTAMYNSRESLKTVDIFIAEVSYPATGLGIEIGFTSLYGKRILCISKKWSKISASLRCLTDDFLEYENNEDMVEKISYFLKSI